MIGTGTGSGFSLGSGSLSHGVVAETYSGLLILAASLKRLQCEESALFRRTRARVTSSPRG